MSSGPGIRAEPPGDIAAWIRPEESTTGQDLRPSGRDQRPSPPGGSAECNAGMFIGDEFQAAVSAATATARMAELASSSALAVVSHAAWDRDGDGRSPGVRASRAGCGAFPRPGAARSRC